MQKTYTFFLLLLFTATLKAQEDTSRFVDLEAVYSGLPWANVRGGIDQGFVYMGNLDMTGNIHLDRLFSMENDLTLFAYGLGNHGGKATELMGDFQVASNIEAPTSWRIFELWLQLNLFDENLSVLTGLYDLNSEFDVLKPGTLFINSSFGIGAEYAQSGKNGPSIFPISSLGVRFGLSPHDRLKLKVAILDGVPGDPNQPKSNEVTLSEDEGMLIAIEASVFTGTEFMLQSQDLMRKSVTRRNKVGREHEILTDDKINIGGWYYTGSFPIIHDPQVTDMGNWGAYVGVQKYVFAKRSETKYLSLFGRFGIAADRFNRLGSALSGGIVFSELSGWARDYLGFAFSSGFNGAAFMDVNPNATDSETVIEGTYSISLTNWLTLQPDVQYIINSDTQRDLSNPLAFAMLVQFSVSGR